MAYLQLCFLLFCLQLIAATNANITVAIDGTGDYTTIAEALNAAPNNSIERFNIYIKAGIYKEIVRVGVEKQNITFIGDGMDVTIISNNRSNQTGWSTMDSATLGIDGSGFMAINLTIENTAGPENGQAVALRSGSYQSVFYRCGIYGYQDTLFTQTKRQFYRECRILGTVDFIFGEGPVVFQKCEILARQALQGQGNTITANGRATTEYPNGYSFHLCNVSGDKDLVSSESPTPTYLGRPWKEYSTTVFMQSYLDWVIHPQGWLEWNKSYEDTLFYAEYSNNGSGANTKNRIKWPGYHSSLELAVAKNFTVSEFLSGDQWLPATGVPYDSSLV